MRPKLGPSQEKIHILFAEADLLPIFFCINRWVIGNNEVLELPENRQHCRLFLRREEQAIVDYHWAANLEGFDLRLCRSNGR